MTDVVVEDRGDPKGRVCVDECPVGCIYEARRMLYIHPHDWVDCGACEAVGTVDAICYEDDVPAEQGVFVAVNPEVFDTPGYPGGAGRFGTLEHQHAFVAGLSETTGTA